jgi:hypothetical protein
MEKGGMALLKCFMAYLYKVRLALTAQREAICNRDNRIPLELSSWLEELR